MTYASQGEVQVLTVTVQNEGRELRETKLLRQFDECVRYLNQSLPEEHHIIYKAFDIANANKKWVLSFSFLARRFKSEDGGQAHRRCY